MRRLAWHLGFGSDDPEYNEWERHAFRTVLRACMTGAVYGVLFAILAFAWQGFHLRSNEIGAAILGGLIAGTAEHRHVSAWTRREWLRLTVALTLAVAFLALINALF